MLQTAAVLSQSNSIMSEGCTFIFSLIAILFCTCFYVAVCLDQDTLAKDIFNLKEVFLAKQIHYGTHYRHYGYG